MQNKLKQGEALFAEGKVEEAEKCFLEILNEYPENKEAYNNLGVIAFQKQDTEQAIQHLTMSLEIDLFYKDAILNYCNVLRSLNLAHEATPILEKAIERFPDDPQVKRLWDEVQSQEYLLSTTTQGRSPLLDHTTLAITEKVSRHRETLTQEKAYNEAGLAQLRAGNLQQAKDSFVKSLSLNDNQPQIRDLLLKILHMILQRNAAETKRRIGEISPAFFDKKKERNPKREGFFKYVPERMVSEKDGLNILFVSDFEIIGHQIRMMKMLNNNTIHKARNIVVNRDYLNYGEDLILDNDENIAEAQDLIHQADFFHFTRLIPDIPGINWRNHLRLNNCLIDYMGSHLRNNKEQIAEFHQKTKIFGLTKYDYTMYKGIEFLMYHFPAMFDASPYLHYKAASDFGQKSEITIAHAPTNPCGKYSHYILPIIERVKQRARQRIKVNLITGKSNAEAMEEKSKCDIFVDQIRPEGAEGPGCPGQNSYEALALNKVTVVTLDNFYLSFYPDAPVFSATLEELEDILLNILNNPSLVRKKMENSQRWLKTHFLPNLVLNRYLHIYYLVRNNNQFVNSFDRFFLNFYERC
jgi:tetratricopeptide (TPR) repeat protein